MTRDEWLEKTLAGAPPLSAAQVSALRPVFAPVIPNASAAPAITTEAAPARTEPHQPLEGITR